METIDPATGRPLPPDAIQRVLFVASPVHVYNIPPMIPGKGHVAASWTADDNQRQIFTARLRVIETAIPTADASGADDGGPEGEGEGEEKVKADVVLEDARTGQLFAAAPYTAAAAVEPVSDSSRFFALRVQDEAGRKATLGVGFEERGEAFDFGVALQEAQKTLGWGSAAAGPDKKSAAAAASSSSSDRTDGPDRLRDLSLKEGETITINLPGRFGRRKPETPQAPSSSSSSAGSFSLPPPPGPAFSSPSRGAGGIPPPPSTQSTRSKRLSAQDLGFDDGKFGEFA
ncbi:DUF1681-domain-containing protein [Durotheca rogersii]|uniref:DUF1681-domain-containing protein n=1 Tax=Durotheca rogersii TaxID=419775 RepID=UPI0022211AA6|nr:DUF1681-domain-containing protein [Durotheca rogersii]KAI5868601.1 DUF1681-domain-containing protein [Durotheca rogersii]